MKVRHVVLTLLLVAAGCASRKPQAPFASPGNGELTELNILTAPVGMDIDGRPGLDGFSVRVFGNTGHKPKPEAIRSGTLEVLMFDGSLYGRSNVPPPLRLWTFNPEQLREHEFRGRIGTGYDFVLAWGTNRPTRPLISVGARYTSPTGAILTSGLSSVTVIDH